MGELKDMGVATPMFAFETLNWARENGNLGAMGKTMSLSSTGKAAIEAAFGGMTAAEKGKDGIATPDELVPFFLTGMGASFDSVSVVEQLQDGETATVTGFYRKQGGGLVRYSFDWARTDSGWKWIVPDLVVQNVVKVVNTAK